MKVVEQRHDALLSQASQQTPPAVQVGQAFEPDSQARKPDLRGEFLPVERHALDYTAISPFNKSKHMASSDQPSSGQPITRTGTGHTEASRAGSWVLTLNGGSSSIKFALFTPDEPPQRQLSGSIERIGLPDAVFTVKNADAQPERRSVAVQDHAHAVSELIQWLDKRIGFSALAAVGHRIVHGGMHYSEPQQVRPELLGELRRLSSIDPAHLPQEIALIEAFVRSSPNLPQIACFDTAFHHAMPRVARLLPIPRRFDAAGIRRYGFHGLSYTFLMEELARTAGAAAAGGRIILAHLGAGASLAAVRGGTCVDTSMGFTPTAGLVMGTRTGDLDPGLLLYLLRTEHLTAERGEELVNRQSGLLGVSEISADMRDLLSREQNDLRAAEAVSLFCYQAKKWIGSFAAALGGLDTLVFAGGIGENAAEIRSRICEGLGFLGIELDPQRNTNHAGVISTDNSRAVVHVIRTDEELVIAKIVYRILAE
jgi:acetate kinase